MKRYLLIFFLGFLSIVAKSQEDTEFWFAAPDITAIHGDNPIRLRITALDDPATVEIYLKSNLTTPVYTHTFTPQESKEWVLANADVENSPINTVNNKGIYIKSTAKVTAYYDLDHGYNMDIFALKGANALGTEFYTPFGLYNENDNRWTDANASIEIIATENGTAVTIEPSVDLTDHPKSKGKFTIYLNKGQTYSLEAKSQLAPGHPAGTKITSNKKIAVTVADDSMNGSKAGLGLDGCADLGGDQIIPTNILGTKYIVMRGKIYGTNPLQDGTFSGESAFVLSTKDGTEVKYIDNSGEKKITINAGKTVAIPIKYNSLYIKSSNPVYVYHISGFQCEMGAAILPTIEGCTGSQEVTIVKTRGDYDFFVNLMVPRGSEDDFEIVYQNGTIKKIPADWFEPVIGSADTITKEPTWMVLKSDKKKLYNDFIANEPAKIRNSESFFHLGVIMGMASVGCKYGYFSSYNVTDDRAFILGDNADAQTDIARCYGEIIQFRAYGGVNRNGKPAYSWEPKTYLSNPYISNPWLINAPPGTYDYKVNITRPSCFNDTSRVLRVTIYPEVKADFVTDKNFACSPAAFVFTNNSIGGLHATKAYQWVFSYPNGKDTLVTETPSSFKKTFTRAYRNVSDSIETIKIKLTVQNAQGCTSVITREVKVYPEVTSDFSFTPNPAAGCNPVEVKFTNKTTGSAKLLTTSKLGWSFGDSTYSVEANPTHIFTNYGSASKIYKTYLTITTPQLCSYRDSATVTVYPAVKASFTLDKAQGCDPLTVKFTNESTGAISSYLWSIDGVQKSTSKDFPSNTFDIPNNSLASDTFTVSLRIQNANNCVQTVSKKVVVNPIPQTAFTVDKILYTTNCAPPTVSFINSTPESSPTNWSYFWDFGDSTSSSLKTPTHIYQNFTLVPQTYIVKLSTASGSQCSKEVQQSVTINPTIEARINLPETHFCAEDTVVFTYGGLGIVNNITWTIDPADLMSQNISADKKTVKLVYRNNGTADATKSLKLKITNAQGCADEVEKSIWIYPKTIAKFTRTKINESICKPTEVQFKNTSNAASVNFVWDFGDGSTSSLKDPTHIYENYGTTYKTYTVKLKSTTPNGCQSEAVDTINIHPIVKAVIGLDSVSACSDVKIVAENKSQGSFQSPVWEFQDKSGVTVSTDNKTATLNYSNLTTNSYTRWVRLIVRNTGSCVDTATKVVTINPKAVVQFNYTAVNSNICKPQEIQFVNQSNAVSTSLTWDFGDGATSSIASPNHIYENYGAASKTYTVKLTASTIYGCKAETTKTVDIHPIVKAVIGLDSVSVCSDVKIVAENKSQGSFQNPTWEFQDKSGVTVSADNKTATLNYSNLTTNPYSRWIRLIVRNTGSCIDTATKVVTINPKAVALFNYTAVNSNICKPQEIQFTNQSNAVSTSLTWDFGDGATSTATNPSHIFENTSSASKTYTVKLTASTIYGCKAETTKTVDIHPIVKAVIGLDSVTVCSDVKIVAENKSQGSYQNPTWEFQDKTGVTVSTDNKTATLNYSNLTTNPYTRWIRLIVRNTGSCVDTATKVVTINPKAVALFNYTAVNSNICKPQEIQFANQSNAVSTSLTWDFGDGATSTATNPSHIFENTSSAFKTYTVKLTASTIYGCKAETTKTVDIHPIVKAVIGLDSVSACSDVKIVAENKSQGSFQNPTWEFQDKSGVTVSADNKTATLNYSNLTTNPYTRWVRLIVRNTGSCVDTATKVVTINPKAVALFNYTAVNSNICKPQEIQFTNQSNAVSTSLIWDFGDGATSTATNPSHIFENTSSAFKTYTVKLTASTIYGCKAETTKTVDIHPIVKAVIGLDSVSACSDVKIVAENKSQGSYQNPVWEFQDKTGVTVSTDNKTATLNYSNLTTLPYSRWVRLIVRNTGSCIDTATKVVTINPKAVALFNYTAVNSNICKPQEIQFTNQSNAVSTLLTWDFGDGATSSIASPNHIYENYGAASKTDTVKLIASTIYGCKAEVTKTVDIHPIVKAVVGLDTIAACSGIKIVAENSSFGAFQNPVWKFQDVGGVNVSNDNKTATLNYLNTTADPYTRWVRLIISNSGSCVDSVTKIITVYPKATAKFDHTLPDAKSCKSLDVQFINQSSAISTSLLWDFGDGAVATSTNPVHSFENFDNAAKTFVTKLISSTLYNCKDTFSAPITLHPIIKAQVDIVNAEACSDNEIVVKNTAQGAVTSFEWKLEESYRSSLSTDQKTLTLDYLNTTDAAYTRWVRLIAHNSGGCSDSVTRLVTIHPRPRVTFTPNHSAGCQPLNVAFLNSTNQAVAVNYEWDFGDGGTSNEQHPQHRFEKLTPIDTTFIVSLRAISAKGCDASITRPITLYAQIVAKFDIQQNEACSGQNFTIVNSSEGQITNYDWELTGDGVTDSHSSASQFDWVFVNRTPKPISRTISLVTQNSHCQSTTSRSIIIYPNPVSAFTASTTKGCQPLTVQFANTQASEGALYLWNFGDTATSSLYNPVHTFRNLSLKDTTYNVTLHAQYAERCQADSTFPITVYAKVKAVLNLDDVDVCSAKSITVSNGSLGPVKAYNWFYDWRNNKNVESTTSQSSYSYTYTNTSDSTRTFRMALVAKSDYCADTAFKDVKIFPIPKVNFEPSTYSGCQPLTVNFNNLTDKNGTVFFWDFGDKANSSERDPVHIFNSLDADSKDYTVHFWATSADGCIDSTFKQIKVEVSPITKFWVDPSSQHYPNTSFTLINATNPGNWEYLWDFDDNTTSTLKDPPLHTFSLIGDYNIKLTASNKNCSSTYTVKTTIKPPLSSTLIDTSIISCPPISVSFKNLLRGTDLKWDFNDGTTTSEANPVHVFDRPGTYHIQLSSNLFGTQQFQYQTVIIYPLPTAGFNVQPEKVMLPEDVMQCENTSELCNNNIWYFGDGSVSEERFPKHRYTELGKKDISLVVWSENGCKDSINKIAAVEVIQSGDIMFPNAFIPNKSGPTGGAYTVGDMKPTSFFPYHRGIEKYKLQIYNRWGELLFETDDINIGWDGYYKGKLCKQDVYVYKAKGKFVNGKNFMRTGDVTLFHP